MKKHILISCIISLLLSSCNNTSQRVLYADVVIEIDIESIDKEVIENASKYVEDIQYIPLETNQDCIIGEITKVVCSSEYIYIYDWRTNHLYQFDHKGKYIQNIGIIGEGPYEYIRISSFSIHPQTENIAIYCQIKQSILEFTPQGVPITERKIGVVSSDFIHYNSDYLFYSGRLPNINIFKDIYPQQYRVMVVEEGRRKEEYLPFKYNEALFTTTLAAGNNCLYILDNKIRFFERCTGIIYEINDGASPMYAIDFGKYTIPVDLYSDHQSINEKKIEQIEKSDYCSLSSLIETEDYVYIYYSVSHYNNLICSSIYSKKEDKSINIGPLWINDIDNIGMPKIVGTYGNAFVGYYDAFNLNTMLLTNENPLTERMKHLNETVKDMDNPVICIIKMKDIS